MSLSSTIHHITKPSSLTGEVWRSGLVRAGILSISAVWLVLSSPLRSRYDSLVRFGNFPSLVFFRGMGFHFIGLFSHGVVALAFHRCAVDLGVFEEIEIWQPATRLAGGSATSASSKTASISALNSSWHCIPVENVDHSTLIDLIKI